MQQNQLFGPSGVPNFSFVSISSGFFLRFFRLLHSVSVFKFLFLIFNDRTADLLTPLKVAFEPY